MRRPVSPSRLLSATAVGAAIVVTATVVGGAPASAHGWGSPGHGHDPDAGLTPRTSFTMAADGSSGATQGGEGIPNIDSVKK
ncbi:MAG: hypothetical protein AAGC90_05050, partial [Curtobacterium sp.]